MHIAKVGMKIQDDGEQLVMLVTKLGHYPIILGIPLFRFDNIAVHFEFNIVTFCSQYCMTHHHNTIFTSSGSY